MLTLIVYESYFGCTQAIAEALVTGFSSAGNTTTVAAVETAQHHPVQRYDLVVVGGPTQDRGLSRTDTRRDAVSRAARHHRQLRVDPRISIGLREWLDGLGLCEGRAAAFDTRLDAPALLTGRASRELAAELRHHGFRLVTEPVSFLVDPRDELLPGEAERATVWARELCAAMGSGVRPGS